MEEASDLLPELESALLELDENPRDMDVVNRVFRALHTIKGSGSMFGFEGVADFAHELENAFDLVRCGELQVSSDLLDLTFKGKDQIQMQLHHPKSSPGREMDQILADLKNILPGEQDSSSLQDPVAFNEPSLGAKKQFYRIRFRPDGDIFATGTNPLHLLEELRELGQAYIIAHSEEVPVLENLDPEKCYLWWDIILTTDQGENAIQDVFIFVEDESHLSIQAIEQDPAQEQEQGYKKLGEILTERGDVSQQELEGVLASQKRLGELLVQAGLVSKPQVESALAEQSTLRQMQEEGSQEASMSSVRVPAAKLDELVNLVGELVIAQAKLTRMVEDGNERHVRGVAEEIERLSNELRDNTLGIRMLPIGSSFGKFRRVVRDLSKQRGKEIELFTQGAETELDKTVIERLNDPLVHILRNSIDHGIETPEEREKLGKPRQGRITFRAEQSGGNVHITIEDDGQGVDPEHIRAKALEKGMLQPEAELSPREILNLIFMPGFSTSGQVSDISGRGVGMDVVKQNVSALRGSVELDSTPGQGSTVRVSLPLTLAIIEGLQVRVGSQHFIIPLGAVNECLELEKSAETRQGNWDFVSLRGDLVPYIRLREWFQTDGRIPGLEQVVVTQAGDLRLGLVVDEVLGQQQTVIKNLSRVYEHIQEISGATIMGDGSIALILDVAKLKEWAESRKAVELDLEQTKDA